MRNSASSRSTAATPKLWKIEMTLLHLHHDENGFARQNTLWIEKVLRRIGAALRTFHRAMVRAKLRRLRNELLFRPDYNEMFAPEQDATRSPQRPLILGDKWDF
jgi:hypothetical protein